MLFSHVPHRDWFQEFSDVDGTVLLGNNQTCKIRGIGSVLLRVDDGSVKMLSDVRYIPQVKRNLISLGTLEKKGYTFTSENGEMKVLIKMTARREGSLYYLQATVILGESHSVMRADLKSWHSRLGHPAEGTLKALIKSGLIDATADEKLEPCEDCLLEKSKKLNFPAGKHTSTSPLDYVHSDLWGPSLVKSLGGGKYYMSIIDDWSRKVWVCILKEKCDAYDTFRAWCKEMERDKGVTPKVLRTDNGLEYLSKEFDQFCPANGIKRHKTVPRESTAEWDC